MTAPDVSVAVTIRCLPPDAWLAVADPRVVAGLSPELQSVRTTSDVPLRVGDSFSGANRRGRRTWSTSCRVVESSPDEAFAYDVTYLGLAVARWRYVVTAADDGCVVEEQWWDRRGPLMRVMSASWTGVRDRAAHNRASMIATLDQLRRHLEDVG